MILGLKYIKIKIDFNQFFFSQVYTDTNQEILRLIINNYLTASHSIFSKINHLDVMVTLQSSAVWLCPASRDPVDFLGRSNHPGHGNHGQLFQPHQLSMGTITWVVWLCINAKGTGHTAALCCVTIAFTQSQMIYILMVWVPWSPSASINLKELQNI